MKLIAILGLAAALASTSAIAGKKNKKGMNKKRLANGQVVSDHATEHHRFRVHRRATAEEIRLAKKSAREQFIKNRKSCATGNANGGDVVVIERNVNSGKYKVMKYSVKGTASVRTNESIFGNETITTYNTAFDALRAVNEDQDAMPMYSSMHSPTKAKCEVTWNASCKVKKYSNIFKVSVDFEVRNTTQSWTGKTKNDLTKMVRRPVARFNTKEDADLFVKGLRAIGYCAPAAVAKKANLDFLNGK